MCISHGNYCSVHEQLSEFDALLPKATLVSEELARAGIHEDDFARKFKKMESDRQDLEQHARLMTNTFNLLPVRVPDPLQPSVLDDSSILTAESEGKNEGETSRLVEDSSETSEQNITCNDSAESDGKENDEEENSKNFSVSPIRRDNTTINTVTDFDVTLNVSVSERYIYAYASSYTMLPCVSFVSAISVPGFDLCTHACAFGIFACSTI